MKKILFIAHDDMSGGSARALFDQLQNMLKKEDFYPIVIVFSKNSLYYALKKIGVETYSVRFGFNAIWNNIRLFLPLKRIAYSTFFNKLALRILKRKIDLSTISLIVSNSSIINLGLFLHEKTNIPHICYLREYGDDLVSLIGNIGKKINESSNICISVSKAVAQCWINKGIDETKIKVAYDGVRKPINNQDLIENRDLIKICMSGRVSRFKGQIFAIQSLLLLPNDIRNRIVLDIYGNGPSIFYLKRFIRLKKLENNVFFKGFSNNLDKELPRYDIGLNLTEKEGFGRTTAEYLMHGLYVIGCNSGATPELLCDGKYGALVEYGKPDQIAHELEKFVNNQLKMKEIAQKSQKYAFEQLDADTCVQKIFSIYSSCITR